MILPTTLKLENRASFFARLQPHLPPSEMRRVKIAYFMAKGAHRWQHRKELDANGVPIRYFEHLRATALILIDELGILDADLIIACLMHDSLEDTTDIDEDILEHLFGANVCMMVKTLSKNPKEGYYERLMKYGTVPMLIVKGCDNLSNMRTLEGTSVEFQKKQVATFREHIEPLLDHLCLASSGMRQLGLASRHLRDLLLKVITQREFFLSDPEFLTQLGLNRPPKP